MILQFNTILVHSETHTSSTGHTKSKTSPCKDSNETKKQKPTPIDSTVSSDGSSDGGFPTGSKTAQKWFGPNVFDKWAPHYYFCIYEIVNFSIIAYFYDFQILYFVLN